jgi:hypothetical protein
MENQPIADRLLATASRASWPEAILSMVGA